MIIRGRANTLWFDEVNTAYYLWWGHFHYTPKMSKQKEVSFSLIVDGVLLRMELEVRYRNWGRPAGFAVSTICFLSRQMISLFYTTRSESYLNTFRGATKMRYEWCGWAHWWIFYVYFLSSVVFFPEGGFSSVADEAQQCCSSKHIAYCSFDGDLLLLI